MIILSREIRSTSITLPNRVSHCQGEGTIGLTCCIEVGIPALYVCRIVNAEVVCEIPEDDRLGDKTSKLDQREEALKERSPPDALCDHHPQPCTLTSSLPI